MLGSQRELGALRVVREVKHPNLCPLFGVWFFDRDGNLFDPTDTDMMLFSESQVMETACIDDIDEDTKKDEEESGQWITA